MAEFLVTGAGGFIGAAVAAALAELPDAVVHGATRDGRALPAPVRPCRMDVLDAAAMARALAGMTGVVHCAVGNRRTTVDGTRLLLAAARAAGVRRVVHFSSIAVYGGAAGTVAESAPRVAPTRPGYAGWKVAAEASCAQAAAQGLEVVTLRPAIVYGPRSASWVELPARRLLSGRWGTLGTAGEGLCNLVHARDVAQAAVAAMTAPAAAGVAFNISAAPPITWNEWHRRLAEAMGLPKPDELPAGRLRRRALLALPAKAAARLLGRRPAWLLAAPSPGELRLFALQASYPSDLARRLLGWVPRVGLEEGLADSVDWLRRTGILA
jgi:nucleoside-diphosphate-sugar epimerase